MITVYKCELCNREVSQLTEHHLVPKERGGKDFPTANLCITCHKQIHALYTNRELAARLFTIDRLSNDEKIKPYFIMLLLLFLHSSLNKKRLMLQLLKH